MPGVTYEVKLRRDARKQLDKFSGKDFEQISQAIDGLEENPRSPKVKKLADSGLWRLRAGNFRIVYTVDDKENAVTVVRVARRSEDTYKGL